MALSNTATPIYYGQFRDAVERGEIPVCKEISMQMNRIDALIADPRFYYDDEAIQSVYFGKFIDGKFVPAFMATYDEGWDI